MLVAMTAMMMVVFVALVILALTINDVQLSKSLRLAHMVIFACTCLCEVVGFIRYGLRVAKVRDVTDAARTLLTTLHRRIAETEWARSCEC
jgi:hypothetical protein